MTKAAVKPGRERDRQQAKKAEPIVSAHKAVSAEMDIKKLIPYAKNARLHSPAQVTKIANSISRFGFINPVAIWKNNEIIAGHGRILAAQKLIDTGKPEYQYLKKLPVRRCDHMTDIERKAYTIADNKLAVDAAWDDAMLAAELQELLAAEFDITLTGFEEGEIKIEDDTVTMDTGNRAGIYSLADRFLLPPFSVFNAREGWWQDRKRAWIALGIRSEVGRGENTLQYSAACNNAVGSGEARNKFEKEYKNKARKAQLGKTFNTKELLAQQKEGKKHSAIPGGAGKNSIYLEGGAAQAEGAASGTSIFDPVLCEIAYRWFVKEGGMILDPFAGGSVRGIVAAKLGRNYFGVDLRAEQIAANREQVKQLCGDTLKPQYATGDSLEVGKLAKGIQADLLFPCPPYADLEVYSDDPKDISNMGYPEFKKAYFEIISESCKLLKDDRFAVWVVGEARDKKGNYYNLVGDTIAAFKAAGLHYYNEAILITSVGSLGMRVNGQFTASRKLGKTHQNILVFLKGDAKKATKAAGDIVIEKDLFPKDEEVTNPAISTH